MKGMGAIALAIAGAAVSIVVTLIWHGTHFLPATDGDRDALVISAAENAGFTHDQAFFLRMYGPGSSGCKAVGFPEKTCAFFVQAKRYRKNDAGFYADCQDAGLSQKQCILLRNGAG